MCYDGCGSGGRCNRLLWRRRRALARQRQVVSPSSAIRSFYADIFEITVPAERELQLKAENERILEWRRALDNGAQEIEVSPRDVWQCFGQVKKRQVEPRWE